MGRILMACLGMILAALAAGPAAAEHGAALVSLRPAQAQVDVGQVFPVEVWVTDGLALYGVDLHLSFDPAVLSVEDADPNLEGVQVSQGEFLDPGFIVMRAADNQAGTIRFAMTQLHPSPAKSGSGVLLRFSLRALASTPSTELSIGEVQLANRNGEYLPVIWQGAVFQVGSVEAPGQFSEPFPFRLFLPILKSS